MITMRNPTVVALLLLALAAAATQALNPEQMKSREREGLLRARASLVDPHIVGGQEAAPHQFPWQAGIHIYKRGRVSFCGGSLIHPSFILTAAHCAENADMFEVVLGAHNIRQPELMEQRIVSEQAIVHEGWGIMKNHDIALIVLPKRALLNDYVKTIRYADEKSESFTERNVTMSGWGLASDHSYDISPVLRFAQSVVIPNWKCSLFYLSPGIALRGSFICSSNYYGQGTCNGDSGGPLVVYDSGRPTQVGVTSFGIAFGCEKGWPSVFTRVSSYALWIEKKMEENMPL